MRIARILGALTFVLMMSEPLFACRLCADFGGGFDCQHVMEPTTGCIFTVDGCIDAQSSCPGRLEDTWTVASAEIRHTPLSNDGRTGVAVAAVQPSAHARQATRSNTR